MAYILHFVTLMCFAKSRYSAPILVSVEYIQGSHTQKIRLEKVLVEILSQVWLHQLMEKVLLETTVS